MKSIFVSMVIAGLIVSSPAIAEDNVQQYVDDFNALTRAGDGQGFSASPSSPLSTTSDIDPFPECVAKIKSKKELQILKGKVDLEVSGNPSFKMLANNSMPTKKEKVAISLLAIEYKRCAQLGEEWRKNTFPPAINAILDNTLSDLFFLAADLYATKISYGGFAKGQVKIFQEAKVSMTAAIQQIHQQQQVENQRRDDSANQQLLMQRQQAEDKRRNELAEQQLMQRQQAEDKRRNELAEQQQALQLMQMNQIKEQQRQQSLPPCSSVSPALANVPGLGGYLAQNQIYEQQRGCIPKPTYDTNCTTDYFGNVNCTTR